MPAPQLRLSFAVADPAPPRCGGGGGHADGGGGAAALAAVVEGASEGGGAADSAAASATGGAADAKAAAQAEEAAAEAAAAAAGMVLPRVCAAGDFAGRWVGADWLPFECRLRRYSAPRLRACATEAAPLHLELYGDSVSSPELP